jgi:hypothetical protein
MTLFSKSLYLTLALLFTGSAFSQIPDTLVVYEYIHVTDTVWVEPVVPKLLPVNEPFVVNQSKKIDFQLEESATIFNSRIINIENNNETKMKRTTFFTMVLLTLQMATYGQSDWSIHAGGSTMYIPHGIKTIDNPLWSGFNVGIERKWTLGKSNFSFNTGLGAKYLLPPEKYAEIDVDKSKLSEYERDYANLYTWYILQDLNSGTYNRPCLQFSVPFQLNYHLGRLEPHVGVAYSLSNFSNIETNTGNTDRTARLSNIELSFGSKYWLSKNWAASITLNQSLLEHRIWKDDRFISLGSEKFYKPVYFDFSIHYAL